MAKICEVLNGPVNDIVNGINAILEQDEGAQVVSHIRNGNRSEVIIIYKADPEVAKKKAEELAKAALLKKRDAAAEIVKTKKAEAMVLVDRAKVVQKEYEDRYGDPK